MSVQNSQKLLNVTSDGIIGPRTLGAADAVLRNAGVNTRGWSDQRRVLAAGQVVLGVTPDGIWGPVTRSAFASREATQAPAQPATTPPAGVLVRIVMHWSAGGHSVGALERRHYHFIVSGSGEVVAGDHAPEANIRPQRGAHAAHTLNLNTGSIGVSMAAMAGAVERPFNAGRAPITPAQLEAFVQLVARLCKQYSIPVTRQTVLSHAEVQPTLGVTQRGKWDIAWLPGMTAPADPVQVGDRLRAQISEAMKGL